MARFPVLLGLLFCLLFVGLTLLMSEEIPMENPPLSPEEQSFLAKLNEADRQVIDATILANCSEHWHKVARVVTRTADALEKRYPGLSYVFYSECPYRLVDEGQLDSQGYLYHIRHSEVRLPTQSSSGDKS
jgi:hypothetical protein